MTTWMVVYLQCLFVNNCFWGVLLRHWWLLGFTLAPPVTRSGIKQERLEVMKVRFSLMTAGPSNSWPPCVVLQFYSWPLLLLLLLTLKPLQPWSEQMLLLSAYVWGDKSRLAASCTAPPSAICCDLRKLNPEEKTNLPQMKRMSQELELFSVMKMFNRRTDTVEHWFPKWGAGSLIPPQSTCDFLV